jgi:hypothetical protein
MNWHHMRIAAAAFGLLCFADETPGAAATDGTTSISWSEVAEWPDFTGGVWQSAGAEASPHVEDLPLNAAAKELLRHPKGRFGSAAATCAPRGMPWSLGNQFIYSRGLILILGAPDYYIVVRRVYMDGRGHDDPEPSYFGHSTGHWENDTLIIDTVGFLPEELLTEGLPSYGKTHIVERWRLLGPGRLQLRLLVDNPYLLTHAWSQTRIYHLTKGEEVPETYCTNNRDESGEPDLTPPMTHTPAPGSKAK